MHFINPKGTLNEVFFAEKHPMDRLLRPECSACDFPSTQRCCGTSNQSAFPRQETRHQRLSTLRTALSVLPQRTV